MIQRAVSLLSGPALDWAVATIQYGVNSNYLNIGPNKTLVYYDPGDHREYPNYSKDWSQGGPIIEQEKISIWLSGDEEFKGQWAAADKVFMEMDINSQAFFDLPDPLHGITPLEAAMRCFVQSKLGNNVEIPEELA